ncbi:MAG: GAF domain-containing protein [Chloroflexi bacterium]|nr:GAF domain-containing protein [Chloroflexota bacterium]
MPDKSTVVGQAELLRKYSTAAKELFIIAVSWLAVLILLWFNPTLLLVNVSQGVFLLAMISLALGVFALRRWQEFKRLTGAHARLSTAAQQEANQLEQLEQAQRESEEKYRTLVEQIPAISYIAALGDPGKTLFVSPQIETLLGFTCEEWLNQPGLWAQQLHPEDRDRVFADRAEKEALGLPFDADYRMLARDGRVLWFHDVAARLPVRDGNARIMQGVLLDITARQVAEEAEREQHRLADALKETAAALNSTLQPDAVIDHILDSMGNLVPCNAAHVLLLDDGVARVIRSRTFAEQLPTVPPQLQFPLAQFANLRQMYETKRPLLIPDVEAYADWIHMPAQPWVRAHLGAPLCVKDKVIGFIALSSTTPRVFQERHCKTLEALGQYAAIAMENARLHAEREHKLRELDALRKVAISVNSTLDLDKLLDLVMRELKSLLSVERASLMLLDAASGELYFRVALGDEAKGAQHMRLPLSEGIAGWVARQGKPTRVNDVSTDPRWCPNIDTVTGYVTRSILAAPLKTNDKVIGVIEALNKLDGAFDDHDEHLLEMIAVEAAIAIEHARLFTDLETTNRALEKQNAEILASRNILRVLFDGITDSICIMDRNMRVEALNQATANQVRKTPRALWQLPCNQVLCRTDELCLTCPVTQSFRTGKVVDAIQSHTLQNGDKRTRVVRTYPVENETGAVDRVVYLAKDITEERRLQTSLIQSARLSIVGELSASIAHEISNPLTAVIANAQMLLRAIPPGDACFEYAQIIERAGQRAERFARNLLSFARQEEYQFVPLDVNETIEDALALIAVPLKDAGIRIIRQLAENLPAVTGSASHLQTVWTNLLFNARDAIPAERRGQVQIAAHADKTTQTVYVRISDNGCGISEQDMPHLFEPLFTTKPRDHGTGLGLYICRTILTRHGGTIYVESKVGSGSTFTVCLPIAEA